MLVYFFSDNFSKPALLQHINLEFHQYLLTLFYQTTMDNNI